MIIWTSALLFGIYKACTASSGTIDSLRHITSSDSNREYLAIFKASVTENIKYTLALGSCASFVLTLPLSLYLVCFKGFCAGFTSAVILRIYGFKGVAVSFIALIMPYCMSLPVFMVMYAVSLKYQISLIKNRKKFSKQQRKKEQISYVLAMLILFSHLTLLSCAEAFFVPQLMKLI